VFSFETNPIYSPLKRRGGKARTKYETAIYRIKEKIQRVKNLTFYVFSWKNFGHCIVFIIEVEVECAGNVLIRFGSQIFKTSHHQFVTSSYPATVKFLKNAIMCITSNFLQF
jgi:hypothetical protein